jgi:hypothetical protein
VATTVPARLQSTMARSRSFTGLIPIAFNATTFDHLAGEPTESVRTSRPIMSLTQARIITISEAGRHQPRSDRPSGRVITDHQGVDTVALLCMINGKVVPNKAIWGG